MKNKETVHQRFGFLRENGVIGINRLAATSISSVCGDTVIFFTLSIKCRLLRQFLKPTLMTLDNASKGSEIHHCAPLGQALFKECCEVSSSAFPFLLFPKWPHPGLTLPSINSTYIHFRHCLGLEIYYQ